MQEIMPQYKRQNIALLYKIANNSSHLANQYLIKNTKKMDIDLMPLKQVINNDLRAPQSYRYQKSTFSSPKIGEKEEQVSSPIPNSFKTPRIIFSYNRKRAQNQEKVFKYIPGSCRQIFKQPEEQCQVQQFQIPSKKLSKLAKQLKLSILSCVIEYNYKPQIKTGLIQNSNQERRHKADNFSLKTGDVSKIASTQANSSGFESQYIPNLQSSKQKTILAFDQRKRIKRQQKSLSLLDRVSPSKLLKKTIILSKYDFGGMFNGQNSKIKSPKLQKYESQTNITDKWQKCVKCLFDSDQNLKESIHYGPEIRKKEDNANNYLIGFGREIEASCIPEQQ